MNYSKYPYKSVKLIPKTKDLRPKNNEADR